MKKNIYEFWKEYEISNEIDRDKMIMKLNIGIKGVSERLRDNVSISILRSYFDDVMEVMDIREAERNGMTYDFEEEKYKEE